MLLFPPPRKEQSEQFILQQPPPINDPGDPVDIKLHPPPPINEFAPLAVLQHPANTDARVAFVELEQPPPIVLNWEFAELFDPPSIAE